jgi:chitinase
MMTLKRLLLLMLLSVGGFAQAHSVTLSWNWAQGTGPAATGFNVYRSTTAAGPFANVGSSTSPAVMTFTDASPAVQVAGSTFFYYVTAFNATAESAPSSTVSGTIPLALSVPAGLSISVK